MTTAPARPKTLRLENLTKVFQTAEGPATAVSDASFVVEGNTFFTMLGPSGCGKTTTLRMIAGLEQATSGNILLDGADFRRMNPFDRNIGMVFQSYALFPHMTVFENVAYGLRLRKAPESEIRERVGQTLDMLRLSGMEKRYPADLSGGQQQRVSIGRALVYRPNILLLDEPLANLDAKLRVEMRDEIRRLQKQLGVMALYVTHDQEEAMAISDRIAVFYNGRLMQVGAPYEIYSRPTSLFVADFIGKANFFPVTLAPDGHAHGRDGQSFSGLNVVEARHEDEWFETPETALMMCRPEKMWLGPDAGAHDPGFTGQTVRIQFLGTFVRYLVTCDAARGDVTVDLPGFADGVSEGDTVRFGPTKDGTIFVRGAP